MKKILALFTALFLLCAIVGIAQAEDAQGEQITKAVTEPISFDFAAEGQFVYDPSSGKISPALGLQFATFLGGIVEARGLVTVDTVESDTFDKAGLGVGVNIPKLTTLLGGEWLAKVVNPSLGIAGLYDFGDRKASVGVYATIVKVPLN